MTANSRPPDPRPASGASPDGAGGRADLRRSALGLVRDLDDSLTEILGQSQLVLRAVAEGTDVTVHVDHIVRAVGRSADLTRRMRALHEGSIRGATAPAVPRMIVPPVRVPPAAPRRTAGRAETVLVVEDDELLRGLVVSLLVGNGYTVLEAPLAIEALGLSDGHAGVIAAVVTDVNMPQMQGPEFVAELRRSRPDIRTLFVSGDPHFGERQTPDETSRSLFLPKPFTADQVLTSLRALLDDAATTPV